VIDWRGWRVFGGWRLVGRTVGVGAVFVGASEGSLVVEVDRIVGVVGGLRAPSVVVPVGCVAVGPVCLLWCLGWLHPGVSGLGGLGGCVVGVVSRVIASGTSAVTFAVPFAFPLTAALSRTFAVTFAVSFP
jgi:hypothetical protein